MPDVPVPARDTERGLWRFSGWRLDRRARRLTDPQGAVVTLTKGESRTFWLRCAQSMFQLHPRTLAAGDPGT